MDFEAWTHSSFDRERQRRLWTGYGVGAVGIATAVALFSLASPGVAEEAPEEKVVDVSFASEPEPEPEPEEAKPESQPQAVQNRPAGPKLQKLRPPTQVPERKPREVDVASDDNPYASGDPYMYGAGASGAAKTSQQVVVVATTPRPTAAAAAPRGPIRVTEDVIAPVPIEQPQPEYPASAKAASISGTVVVKFVVTESGLPTQVKAIKGPDELRSSCERAVLGSRFRPASLQGKQVSVYRIRNCVFRLKT